MNPVEPPFPPVAGWRTVVYGASQPDYRALPSVVREDGLTITEWEITEEERLVLLRSGRIRISVLTFNGPLQPLLPEVIG
jgi:hypothetical protein